MIRYEITGSKKGTLGTIRPNINKGTGVSGSGNKYGTNLPGVSKFGTNAAAGGEVGSLNNDNVYPNIYPTYEGKRSDYYSGIKRQSSEVNNDGYRYLYQTTNGIKAEELGRLHNKNTPSEALRSTGYYSYTGPDNKLYTVQYTADENGFIPQGAHIPGINAIIRSLNYKKSLGLL